MKVDWGTAKWRNLLEHLFDEKCDKNEYIDYYGAYTYDEKERMAEKLIWSKGTTGIACWWAPGHNEGFYMECRPTVDENGQDILSKEGILGKFWETEEAERCTLLAQRFINKL